MHQKTPTTSEELQWYCLRSKPRNEKLTSQLLRTEMAIEVFCPFVRFERARRSGRLWVTEAMFPGYLFARFSFATQHRMIRATRGVTSVVGFGGQPAIVAPEIIAELRNSIKDQETIVVEPGIAAGDEVHVVAGPFRGLRVIVTKVMPARERVAILLEVLGMEREVEVAMDALLPDSPHPMTRRTDKASGA